jgi:hypothetical protein
MRQLLLDLWNDEAGSVSTEWAFVASILVLGAITGLVASRQARLEGGERPAAVRAR